MRLARPSRPVLIALLAGVLVVVAVVVVLVVTMSGPTAPGPVEFTAGTVRVAAEPVVYCDVAVTSCEKQDTVASARVPVGTPLGVTVPPEVAATPWQVAFVFRDATGAEQSGRSPVFAPGSRSTYSLVLPDPAGRLERAEVQQYGAAVVPTPQGPAFSTRSTWILVAD